MFKLNISDVKYFLTMENSKCWYMLDWDNAHSFSPDFTSTILYSFLENHIIRLYSIYG